AAAKERFGAAQKSTKPAVAPAVQSRTRFRGFGTRRMMRAEDRRAAAMPTRKRDARAAPWLADARSHAMKAEAAQKTMQNSMLTATSRSTQRPTIDVGANSPPEIYVGASLTASRQMGHAMAASTSRGIPR